SRGRRHTSFSRDWSSDVCSSDLTLHPLERLPTEQLAVTPPSARVTGEPGNMRIIERSCQALPTADMRQRIVDIAVQEWAYFGRKIGRASRRERVWISGDDDGVDT